MGDKIKVHVSQGYQIRQRGVFNFDNLYKEMRDYLERRDYEFYEKAFERKNKSNGQEIVIDWLAEKTVTEFIKYQIKISFFFYQVVPASENLVEGIGKIDFRAFILTDPYDKWTHTKLKKFLHKLYINIFFKDTIIKHMGKLDKDIKDLHEVAKEVLDFYR